MCFHQEAEQTGELDGIGEQGVVAEAVPLRGNLVALSFFINLQP